ncbi:Nramp family divalent metal transporter [Massilia putida]|uniref:Nramp family divalent metal transporter n=1 Tax=Massilia putida TaxID=1141883 RepID=UPI00095104AF|nr:Nramp family divalent metal transporter [Massilia putida]
MARTWKSYLREIGPGFITGVSDDDPSGIATYSQAGAQFGTSLLWVALFFFPLMASVQEISARMGRVTGHGLVRNIRTYCPTAWLYLIVFLIVVSNTINIGADLAGMAAALELIIGRDRLHLYPILLSLGSVVSLTWLSYNTYSTALKWIGLSIFSYVAVAFFVHIPWPQVAHDVLLPQLHLSHDYLSMLTAVMGTTISPYLFVWQSSLEVEEQRATPGERPVRSAPQQARSQFLKVRLDTYTGMFVSCLVMFFIILSTAMTLNNQHVTQIETASQAARALEPVAGKLAFALFATGIVGAGLLAVPTLAGSVGYAVGEAFNWPTGLDYKPFQAKRFYAIIAVATLMGMAMNLFGIDPIKALILSAFINGVLSVPMLCTLLLLARNHSLMGKFVAPYMLVAFGWITAVLMTGAALVTVAGFL